MAEEGKKEELKIKPGESVELSEEDQAFLNQPVKTPELEKPDDMTDEQWELFKQASAQGKKVEGKILGDLPHESEAERKAEILRKQAKLQAEIDANQADIDALNAANEVEKEKSAVGQTKTPALTQKQIDELTSNVQSEPKQPIPTK